MRQNMKHSFSCVWVIYLSKIVFGFIPLSVNFMICYDITSEVNSIAFISICLTFTPAIPHFLDMQDDMIFSDFHRTAVTMIEQVSQSLQNTLSMRSGRRGKTDGVFSFFRNLHTGFCNSCFSIHLQLGSQLEQVELMYWLWPAH